MSPPQLSADTPIFNIIHPLKISFIPVFRNKLNIAIFNGAMAGSANGFDLHTIDRLNKVQ